MERDESGIEIILCLFFELCILYYSSSFLQRVILKPRIYIETPQYLQGYSITAPLSKT